MSYFFMENTLWQEECQTDQSKTFTWVKEKVKIMFHI